MIKFYCSSCQKNQPVIIEEFKKDQLNGEKIWADVVCSQCHLVLISLEADEPGIFNFVLVEKTS